MKDSKDTSKPNFDTLRKAAEENAESEDESGGDDTDIEILEDGLEERSQQKTVQKGKSGSDSSNPMIDNPKGSQSSNGVESSEALEEKLDTIIKQNQEMIEILRSFGS